MDYQIASRIAVDPVDKETKKMIKFVAKKLAIIGDQLSQSHEEKFDSRASLIRGIPCETLESFLGILALVLKA